MKSTGLLFLFFHLSAFSIIAQEVVNQPGLGRGSIESQYNYVINESERVENNRVVKSWWLFTLKKQVMDTLDYHRGQISELQQTIDHKVTEIDSLQLLLSNINANLTEVKKVKDSMPLLGVLVNKKTYNSIMWSAIGILVFMLVSFIVLFKQRNVLTQKAKQQVQDLNHEYEDYRKKALLREQQTVRKLYDEVLRYKNMSDKI